jgi:hypothetical protein
MKNSNFKPIMKKFLALVFAVAFFACETDQQLTPKKALSKDELAEVLSKIPEFQNLSQLEIDFLNKVDEKIGALSAREIETMAETFNNSKWSELTSEQKEFINSFLADLDNDFLKAKQKLIEGLNNQYKFEPTDLRQVLALRISRNISFGKAEPGGGTADCNKVRQQVYDMVFDEAIWDYWDVVEADREATKAANYAYIGCTLANGQKAE